jgi:hypothetical protein
MRAMRHLFLMCLVSTLLQACSTLGDARRAEGDGVKRTYPGSVAATWDAILQALPDLNLAVASDSRAKGYVLAQRGPTAFSMGENVAIFVRKKTETSSEVEVVSKKALTTNVFVPDWSEDIHKELAARMVAR